MGIYLNYQKLLTMLLLFILTSCTVAFPASSEDDRFLEREYYNTPGAHQLASWLTLQLRRNDYPLQQDVPVIPYRMSGVQGKRNSELTNSMMGIPRNMINNGRK